MAKKCPEHGLLLRGKNSRFCPACGKALLSFSVWPLWKIYLSHRTALFVMIPVIFFGLVFAFDMPAGVSGCNARRRVASQEREARRHVVEQEQEARRHVVEQEQEAQLKVTIEEMPEEWRSIYAAITLMDSSSSWATLKDFLDKVQDEEKLPHLTPEQLILFLEHMYGGSIKSKAFVLINEKMESGS